MKVKNVLNGIMAHDDVTQLTIIKGYEVQCSLAVETFLDAVKDSNNMMHLFAKDLSDSEVIAKDFNCGNKLFLFIE